MMRQTKEKTMGKDGQQSSETSRKPLEGTRVSSEGFDSDDGSEQEVEMPTFIDLKDEFLTEPMRFKYLPYFEPSETFLNETCPFCGERCQKWVFDSGPTGLGCRFKAHYTCLLRVPDTTDYKVRGFPRDIQRAVVAAASLPVINEQGLLTKGRVALNLTLSHPLTNLTFASVDRRLPLYQGKHGQRFVTYSFVKDNSSASKPYEPNYICLPFNDFRVQFELDTDLSQPPHKHDFIVMFNPDLKMDKKTVMTCKSQGITLEIQVYLADYKPIISLKNYKYPYGDRPMIVIKRLLCEVQHTTTIASGVSMDHPGPATPEFQQYQDQRSRSSFSMEEQRPNSLNGFGSTINQKFLQNYPQQNPIQQAVYHQYHEYMSEGAVSPTAYNMYPNNYFNQNYLMSHFSPHYGSPMQHNMQVPQYPVVNETYRNESPIEHGGNESPSNDANTNAYKQVRQWLERGEIAVQANTNNGSRHLQKYLKKCSTEEVSEVLEAIQNQLEGFVTNDYANYMLQSLISACNVDQRVRIVRKLLPHLADLCKNKQGTHCLQALITKVTTVIEQKTICQSVEPRFIELSESLNPSHLILKMISGFDLEQLKGLLVKLKKDFLRLSQNQFGVLVVKRFMEKVKGNEALENDFIDLVGKNIDLIIQDQFGNYVVQNAFDVYKQETCAPLTERIIQKFPQYSVQKYSSCVVERCVEMYFTNIQAELLKTVMNNLESLEEMLKFPVPSNILQRILKRNKTHPLLQHISKVLSSSRMGKYASAWDSILYDQKEKAATGRVAGSDACSSFGQAVRHANRQKEPSHKGSKTPNNLG